MKAVIEIEMDNAAFEERNNLELFRILERLTAITKGAGVLEVGEEYTCRDYNGNRVGQMRIEE